MLASLKILSAGRRWPAGLYSDHTGLDFKADLD